VCLCRPWRLSNVLVGEPVLCSSHSRIALPMMKFFILFFGMVLATSTQARLRDVCCELINQKTRIADNKPTLEKTRIAMSARAETEKYASDAYNSGLKGTTKAIVMSGVPGGQNTERFVSIEFAIAPLTNVKPAYEKAIFLRSDHKGQYKISLVPGTYWIGPKAKALDPVGYSPPDSSFSEEIAVVKEGVFTQVDLSETKYAP
jgi:hypothetical protein